MAYRVPKSRLLPPRTAREVERSRLAGVVQQAFAKSPVLVLAAGAGYGKSTLMSGMADLWLTLAEDCRDPVVLGWHLLEVYRPKLGERVAEIEGALQRGAWAVAGEALLEASSELQPHTLVLDEAQRAASREAVSLLRTLSHTPGLRLAILTRRAAPWEVLGRVIGEGELAFDAGEALQLAKAVAPELTAFEVERAHSLIKGWPLGLRLLLRAMQRGALPEEAFFAHPDPESLLSYLVPTLPQSVQKLAARASVLGEVGAEEAGWVDGRGEEDSGRVMEILEAHASDLLLEQVGKRIRFHPLVRQALMGLLEAAEVRSLLTKAADAALKRGEGVRAAGYLLEAGKLGHAADLLMGQGETWLNQGLTYTVLSLLERLPEPMLQARPGVLYLQAEALRQAGRYSEAQVLYGRARAAGIERAVLGLAKLFLDTVEPAKAWVYLHEAQDHFPQETPVLWAENLLNAGRVEEARQMGLEGPRVWLRSGEPARALEALRQTGQPIAGLRPPLNHREGMLLLSLLEAVAGDPQAAEVAARKGMREGETLGSPFVVALAESRLGHSYLARNRWQEAGAAYRRALELAEGGPARLRQEALGGLAALGDAQSYLEMIRVSREAGDAWVEAFMTLVVAMSHLRSGKALALPAIAVADPFLQALASVYPPGSPDLLRAYPFLQSSTLFAWPIQRTRRWLWEMGQLEVPYHPGVKVEVEALGGLKLWVDGQQVRLKREKARLLLALLLVREWSKEALMEALEVSDGEFRVLWSELLNALEPQRPNRVPGYFLKPYTLVRVPELSVDLWQSSEQLATPFAEIEHPEIARFQAEYRDALKARLLRHSEPTSLLQAFNLEPTDETLLARLLQTPLAKEAWEIYRTAMRELELPLSNVFNPP